MCTFQISFDFIKAVHWEILQKKSWYTAQKPFISKKPEKYDEWWIGKKKLEHFTVNHHHFLHTGECRPSTGAKRKGKWRCQVSEHQCESYCAKEAHNPLLTNCYEVECWGKQKHSDFMSEMGKGGWKSVIWSIWSSCSPANSWIKDILISIKFTELLPFFKICP